MVSTGRGVLPGCDGLLCKEQGEVQQAAGQSVGAQCPEVGHGVGGTSDTVAGGTSAAFMRPVAPA